MSFFPAEEAKWTSENSLKLLRMLDGAIDAAFKCKPKTIEYFFWKNQTRAQQMFFSAQKCQNGSCNDQSWEHRFYHHPAGRSASGEGLLPRQYVEKSAENQFQRVISPYEHSVYEAAKQWKERSSSLSYSYKILDLECRIACTFLGVIKLVPNVRVELPNGWDPSLWVFDGPQRNTELEQKKEASWSREADLLFWPRFFHSTQTSVPCKRLCEALLLHILLVEGAALHQPTFRRAFHSLIGCPAENTVTITQWRWFVGRFGPTLKDVYPRMKGACLADGSPAPWLNYDASGEMCTAMMEEAKQEILQEIAAEGNESQGEEAEGDEQQEQDEEERKEPEDGPQQQKPALNKAPRKPKFIVRLGRIKDHFTLHYVKTIMDDDDNLSDATVPPPCQIEHSGEGYWADKGATKFPTLRDLLNLFVCSRNYYPDELKRLNEESLAWQRHARKSEKPCDPVETVKDLMTFLGFRSDGFQRLISAFIARVDERDEEVFDPIFKFLDHDKSAQLDSEEVQTGVLMLLEPALTCAVEGQDFNFCEDDLLRWLPSASAVDIDKKRFKEVLAESVGRMYTEAKEHLGILDDDDRLMDGFLALVFDKFEEVARDCNLVKNLRPNDDALDDEEDFVAFAKKLLWTYAFFPIWLTRSLVWASHDRTKKLTARRIGWIFLLCLASVFIFGVSVLLYYLPIATVILYHKNQRWLDFDNSRPHVSILEAYIPLVGNVVAGLVLAVGDTVQDNQRARQAEEQWLNAQLHVRQGRVEACPLKMTEGEQQELLKRRESVLNMQPQQQQQQQHHRGAYDSVGSVSGAVSPFSPFSPSGAAVYPSGGSVELSLQRQQSAEVVEEIRKPALPEFDGISLLEGSTNPVRNFKAAEVRKKPSFIRTVMSYYKRRSRVMTNIFIFVAFFIAVGHSVLPGLYREGKGKWSAREFLQPDIFFSNATQNTRVADVQLAISLVYMICSLPAVFFLGVLLQGAILHYYDLRSILANIIDLTNPRAANVHGYDFFLPLNQAVNVEFWILLREAAKRKVDPSVNTVVAAALVLYLLLIGCIFIRVVVLKSPIFDLFNTIALYDVVALSVYLLQLFLVLASLNTKVAVSTLECLESAKFAIATQINKIRQLLAKEQEKSREANVLLEHKRLQNRRHAYSLEETKPKELEYQTLLTGLEDNYVILDSALSSMRVVDTPITVLGITVDWAFLAKIVGLLAAGIGPAFLNALDTLTPNTNHTNILP